HPQNLFRNVELLQLEQSVNVLSLSPVLRIGPHSLKRDFLGPLVILDLEAKSNDLLPSLPEVEHPFLDLGDKAGLGTDNRLTGRSGALVHQEVMGRGPGYRAEMLDQEVDEVHVVLEVCCLELAKLDVRCFCLKALVHPNTVRRLGIAVLIKLDLKTRDPPLRPGSNLGCQKSISRDLVDGILNGDDVGKVGVRLPIDTRPVVKGDDRNPPKRVPLPRALFPLGLPKRHLIDVCLGPQRDPSTPPRVL